MASERHETHSLAIVAIIAIAALFFSSSASDVGMVAYNNPPPDPAGDFLTPPDPYNTEQSDDHLCSTHKPRSAFEGKEYGKEFTCLTITLKQTDINFYEIVDECENNGLRTIGSDPNALVFKDGQYQKKPVEYSVTGCQEIPPPSSCEERGGMVDLLTGESKPLHTCTAHREGSNDADDEVEWCCEKEQECGVFEGVCINPPPKCGTGKDEACDGEEQAQCNVQDLILRNDAEAIIEQWKIARDGTGNVMLTDCPKANVNQDTDGDGEADTYLEDHSGCYCEPKVCCKCLYEAVDPSCRSIYTGTECDQTPGCHYDEESGCKGRREGGCRGLTDENTCNAQRTVCLWKDNACMDYFEEICNRWVAKDAQQKCDTVPILVSSIPADLRLATEEEIRETGFPNTHCNVKNILVAGHSNEEECDELLELAKHCLDSDPELEELNIMHLGCSSFRNLAVAREEANDLKDEIQERIDERGLNPYVSVSITGNQLDNTAPHDSSSTELAGCQTHYEFKIEGNLVQELPADCHAQRSQCSPVQSSTLSSTCLDENNYVTKEKCCSTPRPSLTGKVWYRGIDDCSQAGDPCEAGAQCRGSGPSEVGTENCVNSEGERETWYCCEGRLSSTPQCSCPQVCGSYDEGVCSDGNGLPAGFDWTRRTTPAAGCENPRNCYCGNEQEEDNTCESVCERGDYDGHFCLQGDAPSSATLLSGGRFKIPDGDGGWTEYAPKASAECASGGVCHCGLLG